MDNNTRPSEEQLAKYNQLIEYLQSLESVAVAFSSGVDSTFLLYAAKEALGDKIIAVTTCSYLFPRRELREATEFCEEKGIRHVIFQSDELKIEGFAQNPKNRCYICKYDLFKSILEIAHQEGMKEVVEGSNLDDNGDYRPGLQAVAELNIKSPLRHIGFTKEDIRVLSNYYNLPTWNKPSFACLASRFVYGEMITEEKLAMVEKAEQLLYELGFVQFRVRIHNMMARIEIMPEEFDKLISEEIRSNIIKSFREYGFDYVTMDLTGYRTGSMNEVLKEATNAARV